MGEPALGKADGSSAIVGDRGYIFLYNPNGRKVEVSFNLDSSIGLNRQGRFTLRELYPLEGRLWGKPGAGMWRTGDRVTATLDGTSATVLSLAPAAADVDEAGVIQRAGKRVAEGRPSGSKRRTGRSGDGGAAHGSGAERVREWRR